MNTSDRITFDAQTRRRYDENGFLHVSLCHLTKEQVAPYYGYEIPGWSDLGLEAQKIYRGYRPANELERAVQTFNGLPLLSEHVRDSADEPQKMLRVGNLGTEAAFRWPYLDNALVIQDQTAIDALNPTQGGQPAKRELSASYRYDPVLENGVWQGQPYDFRMTNIRGNHVALVQEGRAGSDVVVSDAALAPATENRGDDMPEPILTQVGNLVESLVGSQPAGATAVPEAPAAPVAAEPVADAPKCQGDEAEAAPAAPIAADSPEMAARIQAYLDGMEDQEFAVRVREVLAAAMGVEPPAAPVEAPAGDAEEPAVEPAAPEAPAEEPAKAEDEQEAAAPAAPAMDAAIVASVREQIRAQFEAAKAVRSIAGELDPMAFDCAAAVYAKALEIAGYPTQVTDPEALRQMCSMAEKAKFAGMGYPVVTEAMAADAKPAEERFPYLKNIRNA